jgi:two-component system sensor histidine kinase KdpD
VPEPDRPNPDALLSSIQREEAARGRGRLKVFLGMCAGVGKTYAMLEAARREHAAGRDVVLGYVETHGRKETDALVEGLPGLARREVEYRGVALTEFDLDAALARKPALMLVDELAHTNAPGSRHPKRYQDVLELLDAGIDVFTTLNVQHVESRTDTVAQIIGTTIYETIPDTVLDRAEIELVDLPPDELLQRLHDGKVYVEERARAASANFFRPGNLTALRELALRLAAEHVGQDVQNHLRGQPVHGTWKTGVRLLVALSPSPLSASLIRWTRRLADGVQARWLAVYVETSQPLSEPEQGRLTANLALARQLGAEVVTTTDEDVVRGLLRVAQERNVTQIVFGKPGSGWMDGWRGRSLLQRLVEGSGDIDVLVVRAEKPELRVKSRHPLVRIHSQKGQYLWALGLVAVVTLLSLTVQRWIGYQAVALIYLFAVVLLGMVVGRGPNLFAATLTALCWNFLFVPPVFTLRISGIHDAMLFGMYFVVALVTGQLTARMRLQQEAERQRERRTAALFRLTQELSSAASFPELLGVAVREVSAAFEADVAVLLPDPESNTQLSPYPAGLWQLGEKEESVAGWVFQHDQPAGRFTDTLPQAAALHLPLSVGGKPSGVIALRFRSDKPQTIQQRNLLDSFLRQIALVIDRQRLRDADTRAKLLAESERLGKTLLDSVSHELRTPLAAITSATAGLEELEARDNPALRRALTGELREASARLNRLVGNLLDMTRLESGPLKLRRDWCDVGDLVNVARRELEKELANHKIVVTLAPGLPLVQMDFVLMQQVLMNLLLNAAVHTPPGTEVRVAASVQDKELLITVADNGPGVPPESLPHLFDKFYRAPKARAGGSGLGLSIVKGIVEAHGGRVQAENRPGGGAQFTIRLPLGETPPLPAEERA